MEKGKQAQKLRKLAGKQYDANEINCDVAHKITQANSLYSLVLNAEYQTLMENPNSQAFMDYAEKIGVKSMGFKQDINATDLVQRIFESRIIDNEEEFWREHIFDFALMDCAYQIGLAYHAGNKGDAVMMAVVVLTNLYENVTSNKGFPQKAPEYFKHDVEKIMKELSIN